MLRHSLVILLPLLLQAATAMPTCPADGPPHLRQFQSESAAAPATEVLRPEVLETFLRMRIVAAVLDTEALEGSVPGPTGGLVPVAWLRRHLHARHRGRIESVRDAWGNPLLYWSNGASYLLVSFGGGGEPQFDYGGSPPHASIRAGWAGSDPTDDLLIVDGVAFRGPMSVRESQHRALGDMRAAGTACEAFSVDYNFYPGPIEPIDVIERVAQDLAPVYIRVLPRLDPWGNPLLYWSDTQGYAIVSYGADGRPEYPYSDWGRAEFEALRTGPTTSPSKDLVFFQGQFVQWPDVPPAR